ncbi:CpsD/CapB family tyrosine-protein kinase [Sphingomonas sp.]|uniref:CpsD/CapB family tyrosine-protein kinase n=1 Tax=Sphingomonas sp. TaxID=28214 RepID=UPI0025E6E8E2|nr:CpsD/CapB family tyrosine-protein kinase [Sphingomonas sp.]
MTARTDSGAPIAMPALVSPLRVHLPWMIASAMAAFILILGLYLVIATRFTASAQIAFDAGGRTIPATRVRDYALAPERINALVDRLGLTGSPAANGWSPTLMRTASRQKAIEQIWRGLQIEQTDLTNVFLLRYTSGSRRTVAPIVNDIAETIVSAGAPPSPVHARIIIPATEPVAPDGSLLLPFALALLGAGLAATGTLFWRESRQDGPRSPATARKALGLPVVGLIPTVSGIAAGERAPLTEMPVSAQQSEYARAFRRMLASGQPAGRVVAVCSALAAEGKSTFTISLARTAALAGRRVALIDCDGRIRAASAALDVMGKPGLVQVMDGEIGLEDALIGDTRSSLMILGHSRDAAVRSFWAKDAMASLRAVTEALSRSYDLVMIDTPPLLALVEARDIASVADQAIVVARWRKTPFGALRPAIAMLAEKGVSASLALSFVRLAEPDRGPIVPTPQRRRRPGHALVLS